MNKNEKRLYFQGARACPGESGGERILPPALAMSKLRHPRGREGSRASRVAPWAVGLPFSVGRRENAKRTAPVKRPVRALEGSAER